MTMIDFFKEIEMARDTYVDFTDDLEKMADFYQMSKSEFLGKYSYLTELEYELTAKKVENQQNLNSLIVKSIWGSGQ